MDKLFLLLVSSAIIILIGSVVIFLIESPNPDSQITSFLDAIWWTVATVTTVGYGDVVPVTEVGKMVAIFFMIFGIGILGIFLSVLGTRFYKRRFEKDEKEFSDIQKEFLERMKSLEKNQEKLQDDLKALMEQLKTKKE